MCRDDPHQIVVGHDQDDCDLHVENYTQIIFGTAQMVVRELQQHQSGDMPPHRHSNFY